MTKEQLEKYGNSHLPQGDGVQDIIIMTTGGTIEKTYDEFDGSLQNRESEIKHRLLTRLRMPYTRLQVFSVMAKDSLQMTDFDRTLIAKTIGVHAEKSFPIVVLHGTDTMAKTAAMVFDMVEKGQLKITAPVVFTGAMKPMGFEDSDADQNITESLLAAKILPAGVYISFHNRIFKLPRVRKNKETRTFESF